MTLNRLQSGYKYHSGRNGGAAATGIVEWFRPNDHKRVEQALVELNALGVTHLRTGISWADWHTDSGRAWYEWLIPHIGRKVDILPCFLYTPPSLGIVPKTSSPPRNPKTYADFIDEMIGKFGDHFCAVELWNEPNNLREWDVTHDRDWRIFSEMIGSAAYWGQHQGKKIVLGGMSPIDPNWLRLMFDRGVMQYVDVVGVHGFPGTFEYSWEGWEPNIARIREVLEQNGSQAEVWITEAGFSTWQHDELSQLLEFVDVLDAPVERVYWYALHDLHSDLPTVDGFHSDERDYHFGLKRQNGAPKLLYRLWESGGIESVRSFVREQPVTKPHRNGKPAVLITGGAGFIGTNLANRLLESGRTVIIYDNLSRPGVEQNVRWLHEMHGDNVQVEVADMRDSFKLRSAVSRVDQVYHFAAQVAVTTSLAAPIDDFEINIRGTLNLLEAIRAAKVPPSLVFTSTNKVYGGLEDIKLYKEGIRYEPVDSPIRANGISENRHLDFYSPYGCSKGSADSYILDYARIFGLKTAVLRMSCIYGPHQFGTEDQGWVAHFLIRALDGLPITIYGDGYQVRDVLFVEDLVNALMLAQKNIDSIKGRAFNMGGGSKNTLSLIELLDYISDLQGAEPVVLFDRWRPGDQRYYVSDTRKFQAATGWRADTSVREGLRLLYNWLLESRGVPVERVRKMKGDGKNADKSVAAGTG